MESIQNYIICNLGILMNSAIILAGGTGSRLGTEYPKQFLPINNNQIILDLSINVFKKNPNIHEIILVCHNDWLEKIENKFDNIIIAPGGKNRSDSSLSGLLKCNKNCKNVLDHYFESKKEKHQTTVLVNELNN